MVVRALGPSGTARRAAPSLLDVAAEVLVADPAASLAEVAQAAGIGRTTLHKQYATREDLLRAVGHRALDLWEQALDQVSENDQDGGLHAVVVAIVPIGPQLAFIWRTPSFDRDEEIERRWQAIQDRECAILRRAQQLGVLVPGVPEWWLLQTFYSLIFCAAQSVDSGQLAPLDAPGLVMRTFLHGTGAAGGPAPALPPGPGPA